MEGNSSGIGSNTTRMLPSAQFWKCANSWRRNWRNRYQFESGSRLRIQTIIQRGNVGYWHFSDVTARADDVSSLGESRHCGCEYLRSDFDPRVRPLQPWGGGWSNLWTLSPQNPWPCFIRNNSTSS